MANYNIFKSLIVLKETPLVNNPITMKVSAILKGEGTNSKMPASLEVFADNEKHGVKYSVLKCPTVFVQTLNEMCLDMEMIYLYEHFVLCMPFLLSLLWTEVHSNNNDECEADIIWREGAFAIILRFYKNKVLSGKHAVTAGDVFFSYLNRDIKKPVNMTPQALKASFEILMKLFEDFDTKYELTIGIRKIEIIF